MMPFNWSLLATSSVLLLAITTVGGSKSPREPMSAKQPKRPITPKSPNAGLNPFSRIVNEYRDQASVSKSIPIPIPIKEDPFGRGPWKTSPGTGSPQHSLLRGSLATSPNILVADLPKKGSPKNLSPGGKSTNFEPQSDQLLGEKNLPADVSPTKIRRKKTISTWKDESGPEGTGTKSPSASPKYVIPQQRRTNDLGGNRELPDKSYKEVLASGKEGEIDELMEILKKPISFDPKDMRSQNLARNSEDK